MQYIVFIIGIACALGAIYYFSKIRRSRQNIWMAIGIAMVAAIVLEIFTFNYSKFQSLGDECARKNYHWNTQSSTMSDGLKTSTVENEYYNIYTLEVEDVNTNIKCMDVTLSTDASTIESSISYTDEEHKDIKTASSTAFEIVPSEKSTGHLKFSSSGKMHQLKLSFKADKEQTITNVFISCNHIENFQFNILRTIIVFFAIWIALMFYTSFKKEEKLFDSRKGQWGEKKNTTRILITSVMVCQILFILSQAWMSQTRFQIFNDRGYVGDIYQELTLALSHGKVDLNDLNPETADEEKQAISELERLNNPYNWSEREGINYKADYAFYQGKYYCYYGIVPVVLFYLPAYLLTEHMFNTHFLALLFAILCAVMMQKIAYDIATKRERRTNACVVACAAIGFINTSMLMFNVTNSNYYDLARLSGLAFSLVGLDLIYTAFFDKKVSWYRLLIGSFSMALAVGCRPNAIFALFLAVIVIANGLKETSLSRLDEEPEIIKGRKERIIYNLKLIFAKKNILYIACFIIPNMIIGIILMYYNQIRFGSIFEFGSKYQLPAYDMGYYYSLKGLAKIPSAVFSGLFTLPKISMDFPFIHPRITTVRYAGKIYEVAGLGIFFYPLMWLIILLPWVLKKVIRKTYEKILIISGIVIGVISCYFKTTVGGNDVGNPIEFAWFFFIPIIYIMYGLYDNAKLKRHHRTIILLVFIALTTVSVLATMLLCYSDVISGLKQTNPTYFYMMKNLLLFWK